MACVHIHYFVIYVILHCTILKCEYNTEETIIIKKSREGKEREEMRREERREERRTVQNRTEENRREENTRA